MENNGYSETYIHRFREEISRILCDADTYEWQSYKDIYPDYLKTPHSKDYLRNKIAISLACWISSMFWSFSGWKVPAYLF